MSRPSHLSFVIAVALLVATALSGCAGRDSLGESTPPTAKDAAPLFTFAVIGDPRLGAPYIYYYMLDGPLAGPLLTNAVSDINAKGVDFTVVLGDLTEAGKTAQFQTVKGILDQLQAPYVALAGECDNAQADSFAAFKQTFGVTTLNYSWNHKGFHFITASCDSPTRTKPLAAWTDATLTWLRRDLHNNRRKPAIFLTHHNLFGYSDLTEVWGNPAPDNTRALRKSLQQAGNVAMSVSGHAHLFRYMPASVGYATVGSIAVYPAKIMYYHVYADRIVSEPAVLSQSSLVRAVYHMCFYPFLRTTIDGQPVDQNYVVPVNTPPAP